MEKISFVTFYEVYKTFICEDGTLKTIQDEVCIDLDENIMEDTVKQIREEAKENNEELVGISFKPRIEAFWD